MRVIGKSYVDTCKIHATKEKPITKRLDGSAELNQKERAIKNLSNQYTSFIQLAISNNTQLRTFRRSQKKF